MNSFRHGWTASAFLAPILVLAGCASSGERLARERWEAAIPGAPPAAEESPGGAASAAGPNATAPVPDPAQATSADDLVRYAEANNAGLRASHESWRAELERVPQARALPDPMAMFGYFVKEMHTAEGPQTSRVELSQTFPLFGKLGLRGEMAVQSANMAGARHEAERRDLRYRIAMNWNDYYYLGRAVAVSRENLELLTRLESVALSSYSAGKAPHEAVIQAQIAIGKLENEILTLEARRAPLVASLNADLDRPSGAPIPWPLTIDTRAPSLPDDALRDTLRAGNPALLGLASMVEQAEAGARLAGRAPIPDLTLGAEYMFMGELETPNVHVENSGEDAFLVSAGISLPIWTGRYGGEKAEARARRNAALDERAQLEHRLLAELERVLFELRDAGRRADLYGTTLIPKARQSLNVTERGFTLGTSGFPDLIDAQRTLLEFELALEAARADQATRIAELERLLGSDLTPPAGAAGEEDRP